MQKISAAILLSFLTLFFACSKKTAVKPEETFNAEKEFASANELMNKKYYDDARTIFYEIKNRDLTKKYAPLAQLRIADSFTSEEEPDKAVEEYKRFMELYPEHKYASYAQYQIAMTYFNQIAGSERGYGAASKALEEFEKLKKLFPRNPYKEVVDVRIRKCKDIIAEYEFIVGNFYYKKNAYEAAIKRYQGLLQRFPDFKKEADALFYIALSYKKLGQKDRAAEYFSHLIEKYPTGIFASDAKKELASVKK